MLPLSCWGPEKFRQGSFIDYPVFFVKFQLDYQYLFGYHTGHTQVNALIVWGIYDENHVNFADIVVAFISDGRRAVPGPDRPQDHGGYSGPGAQGGSRDRGFGPVRPPAHRAFPHRGLRCHGAGKDAGHPQRAGLSAVRGLQHRCLRHGGGPADRGGEDGLRQPGQGGKDLYRQHPDD